MTSHLLPPDDSLVLYKDVMAELGVSDFTIYRYVREGRLERHASRRGVTRDSLQAYLGNPVARERSALPRLAKGVVDALVEHGLVRVGCTRDQLAYVVFHVLAGQPTDSD